MYDVLDDTIAAVSSPPGVGMRGIVRLSGPDAVAIAAALFIDDDTTPPADRRPFRRYRGEAHLAEDVSVPAELYLFRAPRSYTRQDLVEIHTVGTPPILAMLLERVIAGGARSAEPGEFTARAFLNGAMTLDQAEAVSAVIRARSDAQLRHAHRLGVQPATAQTEEWMRRLAELVVLVEAGLDFSEEPIEFITPVALRERLTALRRELVALIHAGDAAERLEVLPTVLLLGPTNAGKSSLMNALSGTDRAICSAVGGTTRDILTAPVALPGLDALLLDGAGMTHTDDELIQLAQEMARAEAARVDLLCLVVDLSTADGGDALATLRHYPARPAVIVANKADLAGAAERARRVDLLRQAVLGPVILTSAVTGEGINELRRAIAEQLSSHRQSGEEHAVTLSARRCHAVTAARDALDRAIAEMGVAGALLERADIVAFELREALDALGLICGKITTDDLLAMVFADFCIGK